MVLGILEISIEFYKKFKEKGDLCDIIYNILYNTYTIYTTIMYICIYILYIYYILYILLL